VNPSIILGWQLLERGDAAGAELAVQPLLLGGHLTDELAPLLGAIRLQQGRHADAAPLFARSRASAPREARFAYLHGMALAGMGRLSDAAAAFRDAIRHEPNAGAPCLALADVQARLGRFDEAKNSLRKLLRQEPENIDALTALASVLANEGDPVSAEAPLRRALSLVREPAARAALHNNLAVVLGAQDRHQEALEQLETAQNLNPAMPNMDNRRVDILYRMGRFEDCLALYDKLLAKNPADPAMHRAYNSLLYRMGRREQYLASYDRAPRTRGLLLEKAQALLLEKRGSEARDVFNVLLARDPADGRAKAGLAASLLRMNRAQEAVTAFEDALTLPGAEAGCHGGAAEAALAAGDADKAEHFCEAGLRVAPFDQTCLALLGTAWRLKGDARDEELNGYDSLIQVFDLDPPDGFSRMEDFNAELAGLLDHMHPGTREYLEQSLRGGTQTEGFLFGSCDALIRKLKASIDTAVTAYIAKLAGNSAHPFLARRRDGFGYAGSWSSRMKDNGYHINHIHPEGWISSCYYVAVPDVTKDETARQGWIKFGEPALEVGLNERRAIQPVPGRLLLFPSYMWHGTIAFHDAATRTTIAFDAVPR
jgi:tetratricopeptide (TPR) repeat protein